jgi:hypothetical protein
MAVRKAPSLMGKPTNLSAGLMTYKAGATVKAN